MSTSRTLSRGHDPIASGLSHSDPLKSARSPVAMQTVLQGVMRCQQEAGFSEPSGNSVRPPQIRASGRSPAKATSRSMARSRTTVSGFSRSSRRPRARSAARLLAAAKPRFSVERISVSRSPNSASMASAEPSSEALSTTSSSKVPGVVSANTERSAASVSSRVR